MVNYKKIDGEAKDGEREPSSEGTDDLLKLSSAFLSSAYKPHCIVFRFLVHNAHNNREIHWFNWKSYRRSLKLRGRREDGYDWQWVDTNSKNTKHSETTTLIPFRSGRMTWLGIVCFGINFVEYERTCTTRVLMFSSQPSHEMVKKFVCSAPPKVYFDYRKLWTS